ncbi:MAG: NAD-dependent epimerase/dehydratase family protein [Chloroflexi bacterium]|nr:NAD-dependent epimerase/dehydratase family protein [Chloroflexota bacterium]
MIEQLAGQTVFVTGATGFIGGHVVRRLVQSGTHPIALERTPGKGDTLREAGITVVRGDITDHERIGAVLRDHDIDVVMHLAAWLRGRPFANYQRVNVEATRALAEHCAAHDARLVYVSSIMVYGFQRDTDVDERTPVAPYGDPYGDSKIRSEEALRDAPGEIVIVRPGMVYGPGSLPWTKRPAKWAKEGRIPLIDGGRGSAYPVYVDNLIDMLFLAAVHPDASGETFNAVDDAPATLSEFLGAYMRMADTSRALRIPGWIVAAGALVADPFLPAYNYRNVVDQMRGTGRISNEKAKRVLGWKPRVDPEEAFRRSEAWLRDENIL